MEFVFDYQLPDAMLIKRYLHELKLPRSFISHIKFAGAILLNGSPVTVRQEIKMGDQLILVQPAEDGHDTVIPSYEKLDIVYEDRDILVINKAAQTVSIPSIQNPSSSIANHVKGYYVEHDYENKVIHIVTRLDRDTTGLMLIAKHRLAHALLDRQIRNRQIERFYFALSSNPHWESHGFIDAPIARDPESIITRIVDSSGKDALTEYFLLQVFPDSAFLKLQLHTGRTHQIRVHMNHVNGPLIGDDLYGGPLTKILSRQALHCGELVFLHPFTNEKMRLTAALPDDMQQWIFDRTKESC